MANIDNPSLTFGLIVPDSLSNDQVEAATSLAGLEQRTAEEAMRTVEKVVEHPLGSARMLGPGVTTSPGGREAEVLSVEKLRAAI